MTPFVLVILGCSGHTNANCNFDYIQYESAPACTEAMASRLPEDRAWWEAPDPHGQMFCVDGRFIIVPKGEMK